MGIIVESPQLFFNQTDEDLDLLANIEILRLTVTTEEDNQRVKIDGFLQVSFTTPTSYLLTYILRREEDNVILGSFRVEDTLQGARQPIVIQPNFTIVDQPPTAGENTYVLERIDLTGFATAQFRSMNAIVFPNPI